MDNNIKNKKTGKKLAIVMIAVILILFTCSIFSAGFVFGLWKSSKTNVSFESLIKQAPNYFNSNEGDINLFWKVWQAINEKYAFQPVDQESLFYGAISGMVKSLNDPYSVFLTPNMTNEFNNELSGNFEGIGVEIGLKNNQITIISPIHNSPGEKAGLLAGDKIIKIDDKDTVDMSLDYAVNLIRGEKGTKVTLTIQRGEEVPKEITITRDTIKISSVESKILNDNIFYVKISQFNDSTTSEFKKIVNEILVKNPKGIILDLRNNPGGYLDTAIDVASQFLDNKLIVIEEFSNKEKKEHKSSDLAKLKDFKTVVLVNEGSASASEIVAGALQDNNFAKIIGEKTFGKGSVQDFEEYQDGSSLKLSIAKWLTPNGRSIEKNGITPDIEVKLTDDDYNNNKDPQLDKAVEVINQNK